MNAFSQNKCDTIYLDLGWNECSKLDYEFYRTECTDTIGGFVETKDFWRKGQIYSSGQYIKVDSLVKQGLFTYYYKNGNPKIKMLYQNDVTIGESEFYNKKGNFQFSFITELDSLDNAMEVVDNLVKLYRHINRNLRYPEDAVGLSEIGTVYVRFFLGSKNYAVNIEVESNTYPSIQAEAKRVIRTFSDWETIPMHKSKPTWIWLNLPIAFDIKEI